MEGVRSLRSITITRGKRRAKYGIGAVGEGALPVKASIDIDREFMAQQNGTLTLPLSVRVTGQWRLMVRVWVATRLLYMAARLVNLGVKVEGDEPGRT